MKAVLFTLLAFTTAAPCFSQAYSARRLTRRIAPQTRPAPAAPAQPAPAPTAPQTPPPQQSQFRPYIPPVVKAAPSDPAKVAAEKAKNDEKQFAWFKERAAEGSDHAQYELGLRYLTGRGVKADEKLGREWLEKAAKNGNSQATKKLAELGESTPTLTPAVQAEKPGSTPETK